MGKLDIFYSPLLKAARQAKQKKALAKDWMHILKAAPGVKQAELDWMDLEGQLSKLKGQIAREDLIEMISSSQVVLKEVVAGKQARKAHPMGSYRPVWRDADALTAENSLRSQGDKWLLPMYEAEWGDLYQVTNEDGSVSKRTPVAIKNINGSWPGSEGYHDSETGKFFFKGLPGSADREEFEEVQSYQEAVDRLMLDYDSRLQLAVRDELKRLNELDLSSQNQTREEFERHLAKWTEASKEVEAYNGSLDAMESAQGITSWPRHEEFTFAGGENYKEFLLIVPDLHKIGLNHNDDTESKAAHRALKEHRDSNPEEFEGGPAAHAAKLRELADEMNSIYEAFRDREKVHFTEKNHFDEANIVVHARTKDRKGPNGEKVLFIEEVQSDLATKHREGEEAPEVQRRRDELDEKLFQAKERLKRTGKKIDEHWAKHEAREPLMRSASYDGSETAEPYPLRDVGERVRDHAFEMIARWRPLHWDELKSANGLYKDGYQCIASLFLEDTDFLSDVRLHIEAKAEIEEINRQAVALGTRKTKDPRLPETPFQEEQSYALAVKRLMRFAAENGYDAISWTPAYMQARRWLRDAEHVIQWVSWNSDAKMIQRFSKGAARSITLRMGREGKFQSLTVGSDGKITSSSSQNRLPVGASLQKILGKKITEKILSDEHGYVPDLNITFSSTGYAIGYDQQIKAAISKLIKKSGGKVEWNAAMPDFKRNGPTIDSLVMKLPAAEIEERLIQNSKITREESAKIRLKAELKGGDKEEAFKSLLIQQFQKSQIRDCFPEFVKSDPVHYVEITPEIREACLEPLPMFREPDKDKTIFVTQEGLNNLMGDLSTRLANLGIKSVDLRTDTGFEKQGVTRFHPNGDIEVLIGQTLDPEATLNHEAIHILRRRGLFTDLEWGALVQAAEGTWLEKYKIAQRYSYLPRHLQVEEAIAEAFADYAAEHRNKSWIQRAFSKVADFFVALGDTLMANNIRRPDQIFGAIETGRVGKRTPDRTVELPNGIQELYQQPLDFFYSPLKKAIKGAKQVKAPALDWKPIIRKLPGAKKAEVEWSGLDAWLDAKGKEQVERSEILQFMEETQIRMVETRLQGDGDVEAYYEMLFPHASMTDEDNWVATELFDNSDNAYPSLKALYRAKDNRVIVSHPDFPSDPDGLSQVEACEWANLLTAKKVGKLIDFPSLYDDWTEDHGVNYREILIQIPNLHEIGPNRTDLIDRMAVEARKFDLLLKDQEGLATPEEQAEHDQLTSLLARNVTKHAFSSDDHFTQLNVVVHARLKDRVDIYGNKVLFVEEIQSDLSNQWRGDFDTPEVIEKRALLKSQRARAEQRIEAAIDRRLKYLRNVLKRPAFSSLKGHQRGTLIAAFIKDGETGARGRDDADEIHLKKLQDILSKDTDFQAIQAGYNEAQEKHTLLVDELLKLGGERLANPALPHTPFQDEAATNIALRRILNIAAAEGYDSVAVTPGYMQSRRWERGSEETYNELSWEHSEGGIEVELIQKSGIYQLKITDDGSIIEEGGFKRDSAPSYKGKSLGSLIGPKLLSSVLRDETGKVTGPRNFSHTGFGILYDQQVPSILNKIGRPHGAKVSYGGWLEDLGAKHYSFEDLSQLYSTKEVTEKLRPVLGEDRVSSLIDRQIARNQPYLQELRQELAHAEDELAKDPADRGPVDWGSAKYVAEKKVEVAEANLQASIKMEMLWEAKRTSGALEAAFPILACVKEGQKVHNIEITPGLRKAALGPQAMFRTFDGAMVKNIDQEALEAILPRLRDRLDEVGQSHILLSADAALGHQGAAGPMRNGDLGILIGKTADADGTLDHEIIHILRMQGLFADDEWGVLSKAAEAKWISRYNIEKRYPLLSKDQQIEEAIAEAFADYAKDTRPRSALHRALLKIKSTLGAIRSAIQGVNLFGARSIFRDIDKGRLGRRMGNTQLSQLALRASGTSVHIPGFESTLIRDETGQPRRMYHGSIVDFDGFDPEKIRPNDLDAPFNGFWFSGSSSTSPAMIDPAVIMPVYLNVSNPAPASVWRKVSEETWDEDVESFREESRSYGDEVRFRLEDMGYDGVIWDEPPQIDADALARDGEVSFKNARGNLETLRWEKVRARGMVTEEYEDVRIEIRKEDGQLTKELRPDEALPWIGEMIALFDTVDVESAKRVVAFFRDDDAVEITASLAEGTPLTFQRKRELKKVEYYGFTDEFVDTLMLYDRHGEHVTGYEDLDDYLSMQDYTVVAFRPEQIISEFDHRIKREAVSLAARRHDPTSSREFSDWFGSSHVLDCDGEPMVLFHHGCFDEFEDTPECPMHFGTKEAAITRAHGKGTDDAALNIKTYMNEEGVWHWETEDGFTSEDAGEIGFSDDVLAMDYGRAAAIRDFQQSSYDHTELGNMTAVYLSIQNPKRVLDQGLDWEDVIREAKRYGHDGIVYRNRFEDAGSDSWIAFYPDQIKSASYNNGDFNPEDPRIRYRAESEGVCSKTNGQAARM